LKPDRAVIVTGSKEWKDKKLIYDGLSLLPDDTIMIHGGCRGADLIADEMAKQYFRFIVIRIDYLGWLAEEGGPIRNSVMLDLLKMYSYKVKTIEVIGFHEDLWGRSAGTRNMINQAKKSEAITNIDFISGWCCRYTPNYTSLGHPHCVGYIHHVWNGHGFVAKCSQEANFDHGARI
jgi:hypothetical protein